MFSHSLFNLLSLGHLGYLQYFAITHISSVINRVCLSLCVALYLRGTFLSGRSRFHCFLGDNKVLLWGCRERKGSVRLSKKQMVRP